MTDARPVGVKGLKPRVTKLTGPSSKRHLGNTGNNVRWIQPAWERTNPKSPIEGARSNSTLRANSRPPSRKHRPTNRPVSAAQRNLTKVQSHCSRQASAPSKLQRPLSSLSVHSNSVCGLGGLSNSIKLAPRPQSSLGFQRWSLRSEASVSGLTPPQGFDLASYVKQHKSTKGIIIGKNGEPTKDEYFEAYLAQCEDKLCKEESDSDTSELDVSSIIISEGDDRSIKYSQVPLCWEDQVSLTEPKALRHSVHKKSSSFVQASVIDTQHLMESVEVKVMLDKQCILDITPVSQLQHMSTSDSEHTLNSSSQLKTTLEFTHLRPAVSSDCQEAAVSLEILLYSNSEQVQQVLEKQTYDIVLSSVKHDVDGSHSEEPLFQTVRNRTYSNVSAKRILRHVTMVLVNINDSEARVFQTEVEATSHDFNSVTVLYGQPRSLFFTSVLNSTSEHESTTDSVGNSQEGSHFVEQLQSQLVKVREKEREEREPYWGSLKVPEKFFYKRKSYCNQDEDEDRTDLSVISSYIPDLRLTEDAEAYLHTSFNEPAQPQAQRQVREESKASHPSPKRTASNSSSVAGSLKSTDSVSNNKIIVVPSGEAKTRYRPAPLKYTTNVADAINLTPSNIGKKGHTGRTSFSVIATSWLGRFVNGQ